MTKKIRYPEENRDVIKRYLEVGGKGNGVELDELQERLLDRWRFADELLRMQVYLQGRSEAIANSIMVKYGVCRDTAYKDMANAKEVFLSLTPLNKKYEIQTRIEFVKVKIEELYRLGDPIGAIALEKILQNYIKDYPEYVPPRSPKNIVFMLQQNSITNNGLTAEQAFEKADEVLQIMTNDDEPVH